MVDNTEERVAELRAYRSMLEQRYAEVSAEYDKTVVALSGGALAVSFAFVKDLVPQPATGTIWSLWSAWLLFGVSLTSTLIAMLASAFATRHAISQVDDGTIESATPGGWRAKATAVLTVVAGVAFVSGVVLLACFAAVNLGT